MAAKLAARYLFARKSHSAVSIIAIISVCGVALATMAIVCVLSVFNGFRSIISDRDARILPDLAITAATGSVISNADSLTDILSGVEGVEIASPVIEDNAVAYRGGFQLPVRILGVQPEAYRKITGITGMLKNGGSFIAAPQGADESAAPDEIEAASGTFSEDALFMDSGAEVSEAPEPATVTESVLTTGAAARLGYSAALSPEELEVEGVMIYMPRRTATVISESNPAASFMLDSLAVTGVVESGQNDFDANTVIIDIDEARELLEYNREASAIYVKTSGSEAKVAEAVGKALGSGFVVKDRLTQQTLHLRMISIEKWITFMLLSFILLIASFNVISTISMLIVDKRKDINTLSRIGASKGLISEIFCWESAYVCIAGTVGGMILGVVLCLIQKHFGLIGIGGDPDLLMVTTYPVEVKLSDLLIVLLPSVVIAIITALVASGFARRQLTVNS